MPLYTVSSREPLTIEAQDSLVNSITNIHCDLTGAPAIFVQVVFSYGIKLVAGHSIHMLGSIRAGRSPEIKQNLLSGFKEALAAVTETSNQCCHVELLDIQASWIIEGGEVLPEPGEEAEWLAQHELGK